MTSAAFSLFSIAAWQIHISNASRHTGVDGGVGSGGRLQEGWFDQAAGSHSSIPTTTTTTTPIPQPHSSISLLQSKGIKVTWWNHCLLSANEENVWRWDWVTSWLWHVFHVNHIELRLGRKWHVMSHTEPLWDITAMVLVWGNRVKKTAEMKPVCKVQDVFYEVMRLEKILDWMWWTDELQQFILTTSMAAWSSAYTVNEHFLGWSPPSPEVKICFYFNYKLDIIS